MSAKQNKGGHFVRTIPAVVVPPLELGRKTTVTGVVSTAFWKQISFKNQKPLGFSMISMDGFKVLISNTPMLDSLVFSLNIAGYWALKSYNFPLTG